MYTLIAIPPLLEIIAGGLGYLLISHFFFTGKIRESYIDWHHLNEQEFEDIEKKGKPWNTAISVASALFTTAVLSNLMRVESLKPGDCCCDAICLATWIWAGLTAANQFNSWLWEPTKLKVMLWNLLYRWLLIVAQALGIFYVRKWNIHVPIPFFGGEL